MAREQALGHLESIDELRERLAEAEQTLNAIRAGEVDSLVVEGPDGLRVYALEGASNTYRVLMEAMSEGAATLNDEGIVLYSNGCLARMLETPLERVSGSSIRDFVPQRLHARLGALLRSARDAEAREELSLLTASGAELPAYLSVSAIDEEGRRVLCLVATDLRAQKRNEAMVADIAESKRAEEALREADQRRNEFLATLSHELRNPLAPIKLSLYVLERCEPGSEQAKRALAVIERQVRQLSGLVDDLLDVTRIARNKIELKRERLELNELVRRTVEDHQGLFEQCGVDLRLELAPGDVVVDADPTRLAQVFGNLLQNAAKFTGRGGSAVISVACCPKDKQAFVRVADTGAGIVPEMLPHLFEPFAQADRTLDRSMGGLGLGLALVKGVVELHAGEVSVRSAGAGKGAEFTVRLPVDEGSVSEPGATPARSPRASRRVLIIEDNRDAADSLRELLQLSGHESEVAYNSEEGLARARQFPPDIVLCDIGLPGMDGYAIARELRRDEALRGIYLVALSGYALPEDLQRASEAGFDRHLTKPASLEKIEELLESVPKIQRRPN